MNFRTLIMLAVAALVIIVMVKMNRNPAMDDVPPMPVAEEPALENSVMTEEETQELIYDDMDGTVDVPADSAAVDTTATPDATTGVTVGDEAVSDTEAEELAPAAVTESPADALQTGPAEVVSDEAVTPREPVEAPVQP